MPVEVQARKCSRDLFYQAFVDRLEGAFRQVPPRFAQCYGRYAVILLQGMRKEIVQLALVGAFVLIDKVRKDARER